ncbi:MAG: RNA polymerase sigma factor [Phycisphaerae bacterium]
MLKTEPEKSMAAPDWSVLRERLWRIALALTRSRDDADDLTQQTLVTLLAKRPDHADHTGYARRTMFRLWLDQQRSFRRRLRRAARWAVTTRPWHMDRDRMSTSDQYERMQRAIETLPPRQHATVVLRLVEELNYAEIAAMLGCPIQAVRANLHLARQRIRQLVGEPQ